MTNTDMQETTAASRVGSGSTRRWTPAILLGSELTVAVAIALWTHDWGLLLGMVFGAFRRLTGISDE